MSKTRTATKPLQRKTMTTTQDTKRDSIKRDSTKANPLDFLPDAIQQLRPLSDTYILAWHRAGKDGYSQSRLNEIALAARHLNAAIEPLIEPIARATNNSIHTLRQTFAPKDKGGIEIWFSRTRDVCDYLSRLHEHRSFNQNYWVEAERNDARLKLLAFADERDMTQQPTLSLQEASNSLVQGNHPVISAGDLLWKGDAWHWSGGEWERRLAHKGLLENYDKTRRDALSATRHLGFFVRNETDEHGNEGDGRLQAVFWPAKRSREHMIFAPVPGYGENWGEGRDLDESPGESTASQDRPRP